tara:strand:+ start:1564 stop:2544 length:981 start_codon:yes stop_codon:yes gene_type:complete
MVINNKQSSGLPKLVDTHMLIGRDRSGKGGTVEDYMQRTEGKYRVIGAMSVVSPEYHRQEGRYFPCIWEDNGNGIITRSVLHRNDGAKIYGKTPNNPYEEANQVTREELVRSASKYPKTQFLHFPLLHLTRDTSEYLEKVLSSNRVVKVHGIGSALGPEDIPEEVGVLMKKYDNIVLPHTDYFQGEPETALQDLQKRNDPAKWMDFFEKHSVKGMFAHGARLCEDTLIRVKKSNGQFVVEAGPIINSQGPRIKTRTKDYVGKLIDMVGTDHLVFNTDYPFMEEGEDLEAELRSRLSDEDYQKVMCENAQRFLRLDDDKYLRGNKIW